MNNWFSFWMIPPRRHSLVSSMHLSAKSGLALLPLPDLHQWSIFANSLQATESLKRDRKLSLKLISYHSCIQIEVIFNYCSFCTLPPKKITLKVYILYSEFSAYMLTEYVSCSLLYQTVPRHLIILRRDLRNKNCRKRKKYFPIPCHCDSQKITALILSGLVLNGWFTL